MEPEPKKHKEPEAAPAKVRLIPVPGVYIPGVPTIPMEVDPETAAGYLSYRPAAFVVEPDKE
jgi:hypothetical protein